MDEIVKSENEQKKEYLRSYIPLVKAAKRIEEEIEALRMDKISPSVIYDDMPHGMRQSDLSDYMSRLDELERELIAARYKRINSYASIFRDIERMTSEEEKAVLTYRYMRGYSWEKVCVKMGFEWAQIHRLHARALTNFEIGDKMIHNDTLTCDNIAM